MTFARAYGIIIPERGKENPNKPERKKKNGVLQHGAVRDHGRPDGRLSGVAGLRRGHEVQSLGLKKPQGNQKKGLTNKLKSVIM